MKRPGDILFWAHPLEDFVLAILEKAEHIESRELAQLLGGNEPHHRRLASEVLNAMEDAGMLWWNDGGQWRAWPNLVPEVAERPGDEH